MSSNTLRLINTLLDEPDPRFSEIAVINRDPNTGERLAGHQGTLSVVFRARDERTKRSVALKFFDPTFQGLAARYRLDLFAREASLLQRLSGRLGFLQLVEPLDEREIVLATENGGTVSLQCPYFVVEWLPGDVTAYFLRQNEYDALVKIALFRETVLAVFRLHGQRIAHRDLKYDNLRQIMENDRERIIPIDFGTAIDLTSAPVGVSNDYSDAVGARVFAPIEALLGLASIRELGKAADIYALGCLLHDLFNNEFFSARLWRDPGFAACYAACNAYLGPHLAGAIGHENVLSKFQQAVLLNKAQVTLPELAGDGSSVPPAAREQLGRLLRRMTAVDHRDREYDLDAILRMLDAASKALRNVLVGRRRQELRKYVRTRKLEKIARKQARLELYLKQNAIEDHQC